MNVMLFVVDRQMTMSLQRWYWTWEIWYYSSFGIESKLATSLKR